MKSDTSCVAGLDTALLSNMTFKPSSPYVSEVGFVCVSACSHADRKSKCSDRLCIISRHYAECGLTPHCTQRRHSSKCQIQACTHTHTHTHAHTHTHTHTHTFMTVYSKKDEVTIFYNCYNYITLLKDSVWEESSS